MIDVSLLMFCNHFNLLYIGQVLNLPLGLIDVGVGSKPIQNNDLVKYSNRMEYPNAYRLPKLHGKKSRS